MTDHNANPWNADELLGHCDWVSRLAQTLVGQAADADDLSQDVVAVALEWQHRAEPTDRPAAMHLGAWLRGAAVRMARRRSRDDIHRRDREAAQAPRISGTSGADPAQLAERAECQRDLIAHVLELPEVHSSVLLRRYFEGLSPHEIALVEGKSAGAISHRLSRAHGALRERLERAGGRSNWVSTLLPILAPGGAVTGRFGPSNAGRAGLFLMGTKLSAAAIGVAVLVASALLIWRLGQLVGVGPEPPVDRSEAALHPVSAPAAAGPLLAPQPSLRAALAAPGRISVTVEGLQEQQVGKVTLRIDGEDFLVERDFERPLRPLAVSELPPGLPLNLSLWIDGVERYLEPEPIVLSDGQTIERQWALPTAAGIYGLVTDRAGKPRPRTSISLVRGGDQFLPTHMSATLVKRVKTDDEGRFRILGVPPGKYGLGIRKFDLTRVAAHPFKEVIKGKQLESFVNSLSDEERREMLEWGHIDEKDVQEVERANAARAAKYRASGAKPAGPRLPGDRLTVSGIGILDSSVGYLQLVEVPPGAARVETTVVTSTDLFIQGQLALPDGQPFQSAHIFARREGTKSAVRTVPMADGRFCLGPLPEGSYQVTVDCPYDPWCFEGAVLAQGGASDLLLVLKAAATVNGIVRSPTTGEPVPGRFAVTRDAVDGIEETVFDHYTLGYDPGSFWFQGLRPARYTFAFRSTDNEWFAWRRDVDLRSSRSHSDFKFELERAAILRFGPSPSGFEREVRIYHEGDLARMFTQRPPKSPPKNPRKGPGTGAAKVKKSDYAVPSGKLRVELTDTGSGRVIEKSVDAVPGEVVEIDF